MDNPTSKIRLRDSRTGKEIEGSVEQVRKKLGFEGVEYHPSASGNLSIDLSGAEENMWDGTDTVLDDHGDALFYDEDGSEVPERFIEPFVEGMSPRKFGEINWGIRFAGDRNETKLWDKVRRVLAAMRDAADDDLYICTYAGRSQQFREINATEMALFLHTQEVSPARVGLTDVGESIDGKTLENRIEPVTMEIPEGRSHWDEIPGHPLEDWKGEVENDETRLSYEEWASHRIEGAKANDQTICVYCGNYVERNAGCDSAHCEQRREDESLEVCRTCGVEYSPYGDGYDGECPECADATEALRIPDDAPPVPHGYLQDGYRWEPRGIDWKGSGGDCEHTWICWPSDFGENRKSWSKPQKGYSPGLPGVFYLEAVPVTETCVLSGCYRPASTFGFCREHIDEYERAKAKGEHPEFPVPCDDPTCCDQQKVVEEDEA